MGVGLRLSFNHSKMFEKIKAILFGQANGERDIESQSLLHTETPQHRPSKDIHEIPQDGHLRQKYGNNYWISENIPNEIWIEVFSYLKHPRDLCNASIVCKNL